MRIDEIEKEILKSPSMTKDPDFWETNMSMVGGIFAKKMRLPAGCAAIQHTQTYDQLSILAEGQAWVTVENEITLYTGPAEIEIKANKKHAIQALSNIVWYCIHNEDIACLGR